MTALEIRSLKEIQSLLKSFDTYPPYSSLSNSLSKENLNKQTNIVDDDSRAILNKHKEAMEVESKKISSALDWVETLLSDTKNKPC